MTVVLLYSVGGMVEEGRGGTSVLIAMPLEMLKSWTSAACGQLGKMKMKMKMSRRTTMSLRSTLTVAPRREIEVNWTVWNQEFNTIQFFHLMNIK